MSTRKLRVAYLGPEGSFSQLAAEARAEEKNMLPNLMPVTTVAEAFWRVEAREVDEGIVPIENLLEGTVGGTLDIIRQRRVSVCGEVELPVSLCLLTTAASLKEVKRVLTHQVAFGQCQRWLKDQQNRLGSTFELVPEASTSQAAKTAADDPEAAAIATRRAAEIYGLRVLYEDIEDAKDNCTRFWVIGKDSPPSTGHDKTSLLVELPHQEGTLAGFLAIFKEHNLTMIQTRPIRRGPDDKKWEYAFFIDYQGHAEDAALRATLDAAWATPGAEVNVLGSYPCKSPAKKASPEDHE